MSAGQTYRFVNEDMFTPPGCFLPLDEVVDLPQESCRGRYEFVPLRGDMGVHLFEARFARDVRMDLGHDGKVAASTLTVLEGRVAVVSSGTAEVTDCSERASRLFPFPDREVAARFPADQRVRLVNWDFTEDVLEELGLPIQAGASSTLPLAALQRLAADLLAIPYHGALRGYYLESKLLECLVVQAAALRDERPARPPVLGRRDAERVREARALLLSRLDDPPSLEELARRVGTNRRKLGTDFRRAFGTTVFGCLRQARLEQARQLVENSGMTLSEIAARVGFAHASNLTRAYVVAFGAPPRRPRRR